MAWSSHYQRNSKDFPLFEQYFTIYRSILHRYKSILTIFPRISTVGCQRIQVFLNFLIKSVTFSWKFIDKIAEIGRFSKAFGQNPQKSKISSENKEQIQHASIVNPHKYAAELYKSGFVIRTVEGDGNCLFRAISDQIYGTEKFHAEIRGYCLKYIVNYWFFLNFFPIFFEFFSCFFQFFPFFLRKLNMNISEISLKAGIILTNSICTSRIRKGMGFGEMIWRSRRYLRYTTDRLRFMCIRASRLGLFMRVPSIAMNPSDCPIMGIRTIIQ